MFDKVVCCSGLSRPTTSALTSLVGCFSHATEQILSPFSKASRFWSLTMLWIWLADVSSKWMLPPMLLLVTRWITILKSSIDSLARSSSSVVQAVERSLRISNCLLSWIKALVSPLLRFLAALILIPCSKVMVLDVSSIAVLIAFTVACGPCLLRLFPFSDPFILIVTWSLGKEEVSAAIELLVRVLIVSSGRAFLRCGSPVLLGLLS